jgi:hypothetical protein
LRGVEEAAARAVVTNRLTDLYEHAKREVRREVLVCAGRRTELGLSSILERALTDKAWTVRREAMLAHRRTGG